MQDYPLFARNNQVFQLTLDMSAWFSAYPDFASAKFRARAVAAADYPFVPGEAVAVAMAWSSDPADGAPGSFVLDAAAKTLKMLAPADAVARLAGDYAYDAQMVLDDRPVDMFGGILNFAVGPT